MLVVLFILFVITLIFEYKIKSPFFVFSFISQSIFMLSVIYFKGVYPEWVGEQVEYLGFIFFSIYLLSRFVFCSYIFYKITPKSEDYNSNLIKPVVFIAGGSLLLSLFLFDFNIFSALNSNWADNRSSLGILSLISLYTYYASSSILLIGLVNNNKKVVFFSILYSIFFVLVFKSRGYLVSLFLPVFVYFFLFRKQSFKKIIYLTLMVGCVGFLYLFTRYLRWIDGISNFEISNFSFHEMIGDDSSELELIGVLYNVIYYNEYNYVISESFSTIKRVLFFMIPDFIYEKPKDISYVLWDYHKGILGVNGSYHPTVVGEAYFNHKEVGVFLYPVFIALVFTFIDFLLKKDRDFLIYILGPLCFFITALSRGSSYNAFLVLSFSILCFLIIKGFLKKL